MNSTVPAKQRSGHDELLHEQRNFPPDMAASMMSLCMNSVVPALDMLLLGRLVLKKG